MANMTIATLDSIVASISSFMWGWPLIIGVIASGIIMTVALGGIQFTRFFDAWRYVFAPAAEAESKNSEAISPFQAFINVLSASIGNGAFVGMAVAMFLGGPGAAFWIFIFGILYMPIRFCEVCASSLFSDSKSALGGPMIYLKKVPGGSVLTVLYAISIIIYTFIGGSAIQCNSIAIGLKNITHISLPILGVLLFLFFAYIATGGSQRIMWAAEKIIPVKVGLFFIALICVLIYNWAGIIPALKLIIQSGLSLQSLSGGLIGITIQQSIRWGLVQTINATESGVGTAGILFGSAQGQSAARNGIMAMAATFVSNYLVCFVMMLAFVATGTWNNGLTGIDLVIAMLSTTFGCTLGSIIATFLSIAFGLGVAVAYIFIGKQCWISLTKNNNTTLFTVLFCLSAFLGAIFPVATAWNLIAVPIALLIIINLGGLLYLLPQIKKSLTTMKDA
jgi:AGCS family alanine or glycine:cation symporter